MTEYHGCKREAEQERGPDAVEDGDRSGNSRKRFCGRELKALWNSPGVPNDAAPGRDDGKRKEELARPPGEPSFSAATLFFRGLLVYSRLGRERDLVKYQESGCAKMEIADSKPLSDNREDVENDGHQAHQQKESPPENPDGHQRQDSDDSSRESGSEEVEGRIGLDGRTPGCRSRRGLELSETAGRSVKAMWAA